MKENGLVFDIQGFSVHDGPGCRTVVFMKGCPLHCGWCSNPEGVVPHPEIMYYSTKCTKEYSCVDACLRHAISFKSKGDFIAIDRTKCRDCKDFHCIESCNHNALQVSGYYITTEELMKKIQRDRQYWGAGGGVTLSGGEPLFQPEFTTKILKKCSESNIHIALETCGYAPWKNYEEALKYVDWVFFDIKHMNPEMHKKGTGVSNTLILKNAEKIASFGNYRLIFRVPIIPSFNDSPENLTATALFIKKLGRSEVNVLPMHRLGSSKYELLGKQYSCKTIKPPGTQKMEEVKEIFEAHTIACYIDSFTPF